MASNIKLQTARRNAMLDGITSDVGASGFLKIYTGAQPTSITTPLGAQVLLATLPLAPVFAPAASNGILTANSIGTVTASGAGIAGWYSLQSSTGTRVVEGSVGISGSDLNLTNTTILQGAPVAVTALTYTAPGG